MYSIALCDDAMSELEKIEDVLKTYKQAHPEVAFTVQPFTSAAALLEAIKSGQVFDLLLLDIYMPEQNGMVAAKTLRAQGVTCEIIFMTTSLEHALEAFEVDALQYLVKPIDPGRLFSAMDKAFANIARKKRRYLTLRLDGELRRLAFEEIIYCEAHGNYQYLTLTDGTQKRVRTTLLALHQQLEETQDFVRVGAAYLINLTHVHRLSAKTITLDNTHKIGIPRGAYQTLKAHYLDFYCRKEGGRV
ncbi:MAG: LytTR family DNA-binding domain-containing protein [Eubacterium sp.]